jgi:Rad3-related DNA helicase
MSHSKRYTATFDSENPERGVLIDGSRDRFAFFPSLEHAQRAAARLSDDDEPPYMWRRVPEPHDSSTERTI